MEARAGTQPLFGIIVRMFSEAGASHHVAHFHAYFRMTLPFSRLVPWS
jgi:hypothetical protein